jgi:hypothetical protein
MPIDKDKAEAIANHEEVLCELRTIVDNLAEIEDAAEAGSPTAQRIITDPDVEEGLNEVIITLLEARGIDPETAMSLTVLAGDMDEHQWYELVQRETRRIKAH